VLLHATTGSLDDWRDSGYVDALKVDHRVVLIDLRGHGQSDKPHEVAAYDWPLLVGDVCCVLDELEIGDADVMGYSAGSYIAMGMALTTPERVRSLILGGASPKWAGASARTLDLLAEGMEAFVRAFFESTGPLPAAKRQKLLANDAAAVSASLTAPRCTPTPEMLSAFAKPCLLFVGETDPRLADSRDMASYLPGATLATLAGLNHVQTFDRGDLIVPHLNAFLAKVTEG
jgi:pimeloyl-ACP methyl ester carboxylesterase